MILLGQHNSFVRLTKRPNKKILLTQQNSFVAQITTKLFYCGNKIILLRQQNFGRASRTVSSVQHWSHV